MLDTNTIDGQCSERGALHRLGLWLGSNVELKGLQRERRFGDVSRRSESLYRPGRGAKMGRGDLCCVGETSSKYLKASFAQPVK